MHTYESTLPSSSLDVLIIGAGPAGYMAAAWLTRFKGLRVRIVEKKNSIALKGQADGLQSRTIEVLQSFGFGERVMQDSYHMEEICFWARDQAGNLARTGRLPDSLPGISRFPQCTLHQGYMEGYFRDYLKAHGTLHVEHGIMPESMVIAESELSDPDAYPIQVVLRHLSEEESSQSRQGTTRGLSKANGLKTKKGPDQPLTHAVGLQESISCKYVIGCDGAHSWVRHQLGIPMEGEHIDGLWGVIDIIPLTDFPDIRKRSFIHSADHGFVFIIPRENGLVRLYIQLADIPKNHHSSIDRFGITPDIILKAAQRIFAPYKLEYERVDWFTVYQIGQRVASRFSSFDRVFITGDACHTHSPKMGQGMNVSMMDSYNLAWKIGLVCKGLLSPSVLQSYESERRKIAQELIVLDKKLSGILKGRPTEDMADEAGITVEEYKTFVHRTLLFASGTAVEYGPSVLVSGTPGPDEIGRRYVAGKQALATGLPIGRRFNSFKVVNQADARVWQLQDLLLSDGRWRIVVFAGDILKPGQKARLFTLGEYLDSPRSFLRKYTPQSSPPNSVFHILTLHSSPRVEVELSDFPKCLRPEHDYSSVYVDDDSYHEGHGQAYKNYGVNNESGCMVIVRPDQYVSLVCELEDTALVESFLAGCFISQTPMSKYLPCLPDCEDTAYSPFTSDNSTPSPGSDSQA